MHIYLCCLVTSEMRVREPRAWVAKARVVDPMLRGTTFDAAARRSSAAARRAIPRDAMFFQKEQKRY